MEGSSGTCDIGGKYDVGSGSENLVDASLRDVELPGGIHVSHT